MSELAEKIARGIFRIGDDPRSPTGRIQFMGGTYPREEHSQGGLCEAALVEAIDKILVDWEPDFCRAKRSK